MVQAPPCRTERNISPMKRKLITTAAVALAALLTLTACNPLSILTNSIKSMDFEAKMDLKAPAPAPGKMPKILFVGNSHTFANDLPGTFLEFAYAMGNESDVYDLTEGYYTLEQFADPEDELGAVLDDALTEEKWDFVVLQENSNKSIDPLAKDDMFVHARTLDAKIKAAGAQTAFFMTWSPKNGLTDENDQPTLSRDQIQTMIAENYITISKELDSLLIPGGVAFMRCLSKYPEIELWDEDESHASPAGTYLTVCVAYAVFYRQSPVGCTYLADLDEDTASKLQEVAATFLAV